MYLLRRESYCTVLLLIMIPLHKEGDYGLTIIYDTIAQGGGVTVLLLIMIPLHKEGVTDLILIMTI